MSVKKTLKSPQLQKRMKENHARVMSDPHVRKKMSEKAKQRAKSDVMSERGKKGNEKRWSRPGEREKASALNRVRQNLPEVIDTKRKASRSAMIHRWQNREERDRLTKIQNSPETKRKKSEAMKRYWARKRAENEGSHYQ